MRLENQIKTLSKGLKLDNGIWRVDREWNICHPLRNLMNLPTLGSCQSWATWPGVWLRWWDWTLWRRGRGMEQTWSRCFPSDQYGRRWNCRTSLSREDILGGSEWDLSADWSCPGHPERSCLVDGSLQTNQNFRNIKTLRYNNYECHFQK